MKFCEIRIITIKEATGYDCQVWDAKNSQINPTRIYPINHVSQNGRKKTFNFYLYNAVLTDSMHICKAAKMWTWQMFSHDQNGLKLCYFCHILMNATIKNCSGWKQIWFSYSQQKFHYIEQKFIEGSHSESCFFLHST